VLPRAASEWLRSVVEPGLRLPESFAIDSWGYRGHVLWPPQEVGQELYEERSYRFLGWLWRERGRFAQLH
jgi:hypothetical protein